MESKEKIFRRMVKIRQSDKNLNSNIDPRILAKRENLILSTTQQKLKLLTNKSLMEISKEKSDFSIELCDSNLLENSPSKIHENTVFSKIQKKEEILLKTQKLTSRNSDFQYENSKTERKFSEKENQNVFMLKSPEKAQKLYEKAQIEIIEKLKSELQQKTNDFNEKNSKNLQEISSLVFFP